MKNIAQDFSQNQYQDDPRFQTDFIDVGLWLKAQLAAKRLSRKLRAAVRAGDFAACRFLVEQLKDLHRAERELNINVRDALKKLGNFDRMVREADETHRRQFARCAFLSSPSLPAVVPEAAEEHFVAALNFPAYAPFMRGLAGWKNRLVQQLTQLHRAIEAARQFLLKSGLILTGFEKEKCRSTASVFFYLALDLRTPTAKPNAPAYL